MRLILIFSHTFLILATAAALASLVQSFSSPFAGLGREAVLLVIPLLIAWLVNILTVVLFNAFVLLATAPIMLALSATLISAILSGYRYLRWTRWLAVAANVLAIAYCLKFVPFNVLVLILIIFLSVDIILLGLMPDRPNLKMTAKALLWFHPLLGLVFPIILWAALANSGSGSGAAGLWFFVSALSCVPFYFNRRAARNFSRKPVLTALIVSTLFLFLWGLVCAPLALPLSFSLLGLLAQAEMGLLYPEDLPAPGSPRYYISRYLSRARPPAAQGGLS